MIHERYRGSDTSNTVPKRLNELRLREGEISNEERIGVLRQLLEIEREPNWRGYLLWGIGRVYASGDRPNEAIAAFFEAKSQFDPLLGTIAGVMPAYCDTLESLICWHYYDRGEFEKVAELSLSILANLEEAEFDEFNKQMAFFYHGKALSSLARKHELPWLQPLALECYLRWHHEAPENETCLEHLAYCYFRVGDMVHSRSAVEMCRQVAPEGEVRERIEEFAREHARELDPKTGTS
jgi:tetratricopeptide (TPR) repeat protein